MDSTDTLPYFSLLLDVEEHPSPLQEMNPTMLRQRMDHAIVRLWLAESRQRPLIIICEDLRWVDRATLTFLDILSKRLAAAPVLLLVNYRPEYQPAWKPEPYFTEVQLNALRAIETDEFLTLLLGTDESVTALRQQILAKTEGTPFFMEEVVQTLVDEQRLRGRRGNYRLVQPAADLRIPPTVQGVLAARIDRLAPAEKALLQQLAVIGRACPLTLVRQVVLDVQDELYELLAVLRHKEFLYEQPGFPDVDYIFTHALTHEVTYQSILIERRKVLHQQIAEAIELLYHQKLEDQYTTLAHHYSNSGNTEKAIHYLLKDFRTAWFEATLHGFDTSA